MTNILHHIVTTETNSLREGTRLDWRCVWKGNEWHGFCFWVLCPCSFFTVQLARRARDLFIRVTSFPWTDFSIRNASQLDPVPGKEFWKAAAACLPRPSPPSRRRLFCSNVPFHDKQWGWEGCRTLPQHAGLTARPLQALHFPLILQHNIVLGREILFLLSWKKAGLLHCRSAKIKLLLPNIKSANQPMSACLQDCF